VEMPTRDKYLIYSHDFSTHEEKEINGVKSYRNATMPVGVWKPLPIAIERILDHVQTVTKTSNRTLLLKRVRIEPSCLSRHRNGADRDIPPRWIIRLSEYSKISLLDIYTIGGLKPSVRSFDQYA
jgi:hypothetical protein